jgi:O-antigen ligase
MEILYYGLMGLVTLGFGAIAWKSRKQALLVFVAMLPVYVFSFSIAGIPSNLLEVLFLVLFAVWAWKGDYKTIQIKNYRVWMWLIGALLCVALLAVLVAGAPLDALNILKSYYLEPALFSLILLSQLKKRTDWHELFLALCMTAIPLTLIALLQRFASLPIPSPWDFELRATSIFPYPNALGLYLAPIAALSGTLLVTLKKRFWLLPLAFSLVGIVLAKTEAALVALPVAFAITAVYGTWHRPRMRNGLIAVGLLLAAAALLIAPVRTKLLLQDYSGSVRRSQWTETAELIKDHPIFGVGINQYPEALAPYHNATQFEVFQYPHNLVLNIWVELGIAGVLLSILALILIARVLKREISPLSLALTAATLTLIIHGMVDVPFFKNDLAIMTSALLACVIFLDHRSKQEQEFKRPSR